MHLHIVTPDRRASGLGAGCVRLRSRRCRPNPINTFQATTIWLYAPPEPTAEQ